MLQRTCNSKLASMYMWGNWRSKRSHDLWTIHETGVQRYAGKCSTTGSLEKKKKKKVGEVLTHSISWFPRCKYFYHGQFRHFSTTPNVTSLNMELGRAVRACPQDSGVQWLQHPSGRLEALGSVSSLGIFGQTSPVPLHSRVLFSGEPCSHRVPGSLCQVTGLETLGTFGFSVSPGGGSGLSRSLKGRLCYGSGHLLFS